IASPLQVLNNCFWHCILNMTYEVITYLRHKQVLGFVRKEIDLIYPRFSPFFKEFDPFINSLKICRMEIIPNPTYHGSMVADVLMKQIPTARYIGCYRTHPVLFQ